MPKSMRPDFKPWIASGSNLSEDPYYQRYVGRATTENTGYWKVSLD